jgi:EthD domain-containing protein
MVTGEGAQTSSAIEATAGAKMVYLIRRRATASREELVAHWFANHMPGVRQGQLDQAAEGRRAAWRYIATVFDASDGGDERSWDGMAQLWWDEPLHRRVVHGDPPGDTFQEKAEPYVHWATREHVVLDGADRLPVEPLTLNAPFPTTRSGFFKVTALLKARPGTDFDALFAHWLTVHAPNVRSVMESVGGFRYVVSHSLEPSEDPHAGMAELYFPDASGWAAYIDAFEPDGMEQWLDPEGTLVLTSGTEMIGIP